MTDIKTIIYNDAYDFGPGSVVINEVDCINDDESGVYILVVLFLVMTVGLHKSCRSQS